MHRILFTKKADRTLRKMPRDTAQRIWQRLLRIAADPHGKHPYVSRLRNRPAFRLRVGDWRAIYEVRDQELVILVLNIGSRGEVYR